MGIKYLGDVDLQFLAYAKNDDLAILVGYLSRDKDGETRWAQELLKEPRFQSAGGNLTQVWDLIAGELQLFGGDSLVNFFRGHGVPYKEILCDVCDFLGVKVNKNNSAYDIENAALSKIFAKSWEYLTPEHRSEMADALGTSAFTGGKVVLDEIFEALKRSPVVSYQISMLLADGLALSLLGRGIPVVANLGLGRMLGIFAGPIGWLISLLFSVPLLTGTAYRVTVPCVIQVAYMRRALAQADRY
ncbi:hypothetical protein OTERR_30560 [Oryzomicrobium terrae]|uniref:DUF3944 domain-containing protein n=1 Tax=Oryzomicrobium terrae TaxID=1735038 RepID=A0A5C1ECA7_9RHOO|nr:DUF3944 domain-containing protein [Oryzomicrobium terrae]QEL66532.1 hypothetical protein OTERR_30560 [Oryzomicrobium terrae]